MTKKDFFRVLIKIFALYSLVQTTFYAIPSVLSYASYMNYEGLIFLAVSFAILFGFFLFLIFNTDGIIKTLRLDKNFDDDVIQFGRFNSYNIVKLALIIIAGLLIIENLPIIIEQIVLFVQTNNNQFTQVSFSTSSLIIPIIKIVIAYFLLREQQLIFKLLRLDEELLDEEEATN